MKNAFTSSASLHTMVSATLIAACAMLSACGHTTTSMPMSTQAAMGPVYFGDTMSFGERNTAEQAVLVAAARP